MSMTPFNGDMSQALKWMQNNAPMTQAFIVGKKNWYKSNYDSFWADWYTQIFDLRTATPFGLMIWCIILGVPSTNLGLQAVVAAWAYGANRQNFIYSGIDPTLTDPNTMGGNFYGGGDSSLTILSEIRKILQLRYVALTCNGNVKFINYMLRFIFNDDQTWDFAGGKYFRLVDCTASGGSVSNVPGPFKLEYRIGPNMGLSSQLINFLNDPANGILPSMAGSQSIAIQE